MGHQSFEALVRAIFGYPWGWVMLFFFFKQDWHTFNPIDNRGNSFQFQRRKTVQAVVEKVRLAGVQ